MDSLKKYITFITLVFTISVISGYVYAVSNPSESARMVQELGTTFEWIKDLNPLLIVSVIFLNNALKALLVIIFGMLIIIPIGFIIYNGYLLGIVMCEHARTSGPVYVAAAILPHGIIELPMILLSAALGTRLGMMTFLRIKKEVSNEDVLSELKRSISFYFRWILPLLFIAAVIETLITPIVQYLLG
ncbi:stage II sporulation protein M [ANME-2 cluster archaeon]|nr:MAG: stage II sporulation protein M [ANME-2 cluster archaeon]